MWKIINNSYHIGFVLLLISFNLGINAQSIFPGAFGFGSNSRGAYAGKTNPRILYVDNLDGGNFATSDSSGTFKWCLSQKYPRAIVFLRGGIINWASNNSDYYAGDYNLFSILSPFCNVYGQTAPYPGITIINGGLLFIKNHDILIQHLKFRIGDNISTWHKETTCIAGWDNNYNIVIDHCSFSWSIDQLLGFNPSNNITLSNNIFSEPLDHNTHPHKGDEFHGMFNTFMRTQKLSIVLNIYAHGRLRAPYLNSGIQDVYISNNMIYNIMQYGIFLENSLDYDTITRMDIIGNCYKPGPDLLFSSQSQLVYIRNVNPLSNFYMNDNYSPFSTSQTSDQIIKSQVSCIIQDSHPNVNPKGHIPIPVNNLPDYLYSNVGAFYWDRDNTDKRIIETVKNSTGAVIDSILQLENTFLNIAPTTHVLNLPQDPHGDDNNNGYSNLEECIYNMSFVLDNNTVPIFTNQSFQIADTIQNETHVGTVSASDPDKGQDLTYSIIEGNQDNAFSINTTNGEIRIVNKNSLARYEVYNLLVKVTDSGKPSLSAISTISIKVVRVFNPFDDVLIIYPNPNNGNFSINSCNLKVKQAKFEILNQNGTTVYSSGLYNDEIRNFDLGKHLMSGIYFLRLIGAGNNYLSKIILVR